MKKLFVLLLLVTVSMASYAQSNQQLLEAYRNGTLSESQIGELRKESAQANQENVQRDRGINTGTVVPGSTTAPTADTDGVAVSTSGATRRLFGHDLFTNKKLTFEPNLQIATPDNYVLGPGDEVIIDLWGNTDSSNKYKISPDGRIVISGVGPITLSGLTIAEASKRLRSSMAAMYEGLYDGSIQLKLSLGSIRSIQVNITGEVGNAGTYTLPSLATLFHALHVAGGVSDLGTLRSIKVYRAGKLFSEVDVFDYILNGKTEKDIALRDGDLVTVAPYSKLVEIAGQVKRPMFYELTQNETVADLLNYAGGFSNEANRKMVSVTRRQGGKWESFTVESDKFDSFVLEDGDNVAVSGDIDRFNNRVQITGAVYREGYYAIDDKTSTVKQLIERADGLREDAFMARALLYREKPDWTMEVLPIDLAGLMSGKVADITLRPNDMLTIAAVSEMQEEYNVSIYGSVRRPAVYPYADKMTVEDLLVAAGGLQESASTANITITRRIKDSKSTTTRDELLETFTVDVNDGLEVNGGAGFVLQPFDQVYVRRSPVYVQQSSVTVQGEVPFAGNYPLTHRNMRLSEVISAAGNPNAGAFIEGAYLIRKMTDEERAQRTALNELIEKQAMAGSRDTLNLSNLEMASVYTVGIDLEEALNKPGSDADIVLRDGDVISIPEYNGSVRVLGAVTYPNTITFKSNKNLKYYIKASGGYEKWARKNRSFVIYMNGMVSTGKRAEVRPGCIIIVPSKSISEPVKWSDIVAVLNPLTTTSAVVLSAISVASK
ncbi:MAG: SLBB domain-containing protein [Alistipes sp.]|nr:SLBB domain-containing protein [Alistipes sp.]